MVGPLTISGLLAAYRAGDTTPVAVTDAVLGRICQYGDRSVWISRADEDEVRLTALALTNNAAARALPLYGIPFAVKDNIDAAGLPTTAACPSYAYTPDRNSAVVDRLVAAGAILVGKTNLDQFATGLVGTRSPYGAPRCVFNQAYISGGSSSGSAVAVAAGLVAFALGTDTAGSGRVPAAFNNLVGLKPTRGLISTRGVVPACRSLDCVSVFARNSTDAEAVLAVAQGFDEADGFSRESEMHKLPSANFRFGILSPKDRQFFDERENENLYNDAIDRLRSHGGVAVEFDYGPFREVAAMLYQGPWVAERYAAIRQFFDAHEVGMDPTVREIIGGARKFSAADAYEAEYRLVDLKREADKVWQNMDLMLLPTAPAQYTFDEIQKDPITLNTRLGTYTNFVNLLDYCAVAVPAGFRKDGLAFGVTLIGPAFCDRALLDLASHFTGE